MKEPGDRDCLACKATQELYGESMSRFKIGSPNSVQQTQKSNPQCPTNPFPTLIDEPRKIQKPICANSHPHLPPSHQLNPHSRAA
jgi:hypothetical protein